MLRDSGEEISFASFELNLRGADFDNSKLGRNEESVEDNEEQRKSNVPNHGSIYALQRSDMDRVHWLFVDTHPPEQPHVAS